MTSGEFEVSTRGGMAFMLSNFLREKDEVGLLAWGISIEIPTRK